MMPQSTVPGQGIRMPVSQHQQIMMNQQNMNMNMKRSLPTVISSVMHEESKAPSISLANTTDDKQFDDEIMKQIIRLPYQQG